MTTTGHIRFGRGTHRFVSRSLKIARAAGGSGEVIQRTALEREGPNVQPASSLSHIYFMGVEDGLEGQPPEFRFLNVPRTERERLVWEMGHEDGWRRRCSSEAPQFVSGLTTIFRRREGSR